MNYEISIPIPSLQFFLNIHPISYILIFSVLYGILDHYRNLPKINNWNKLTEDQRKQIERIYNAHGCVLTAPYGKIGIDHCVFGLLLSPIAPLFLLVAGIIIVIMLVFVLLGSIATNRTIKDVYKSVFSLPEEKNEKIEEILKSDPQLAKVYSNMPSTRYFTFC